MNIGDFLIDDRICNGVENFSGYHIHFGSEKFPNWEVTYDYLIKINNNWIEIMKVTHLSDSLVQREIEKKVVSKLEIIYSCKFSKTRENSKFEFDF